jgi:hypothetical protein
VKKKRHCFGTSQEEELQTPTFSTLEIWDSVETSRVFTLVVFKTFLAVITKVSNLHSLVSDAFFLFIFWLIKVGVDCCCHLWAKIGWVSLALSEISQMNFLAENLLLEVWNDILDNKTRIISSKNSNCSDFLFLRGHFSKNLSLVIFQRRFPAQKRTNRKTVKIGGN